LITPCCLTKTPHQALKKFANKSIPKSIDTKTDDIMQRVIREKFCNHTIIAVAHKLDTILDYDRVVVLDAGRIVETGEPYALLTDPKSHFGRLYASSITTEDTE
jgi:ABC-type multidrug transport system fused ATPase/permease subunit